MKNLFKGKAGFTMVELMVVVIIVGILASVSIPLYRANVKRAIRTEAQATLGSIRSAERVYKAEYDSYVTCPDGSTAIKAILGVDIVDAHFFSAACYAVVASGTGTGSTFIATCFSYDVATNTAAAAAQAYRYFPYELVSRMDQAGTLSGETN